MTADGSARAFCIDGKDIVQRAIEIHRTAPTATAALGRTLMAASLMGSMMGEKEDALTLRFGGDGVGGTILACADYLGNVRGMIGNPDCDLPLRERDGKLDVAKCVGKGFLNVLRDAGGAEPYSGVSPIVSGEIAEDVAYYYAKSEQIPTVCALGVLVDTDCSCKAAGGLIIQLLPFADPETAEKLEENVRKQTSVTGVLTEKGLEGLLAGYLDGIPYDLFDEFDCGYVCTCSRERTDRALISLGAKELQSLIDGPEEITELGCQFCEKKYRYTKDELKALLQSAKR